MHIDLACALAYIRAVSQPTDAASGSSATAPASAETSASTLTSDSRRGPEAGPSQSSGGSLRMLLTGASLLLSVLLGLVLSRGGAAHDSSSTGNRGVSGQKLVIGLSFDTLKEERWQRDRAAFIAAAKALSAEVIDLSANSNDTQQMKDVQSLLTSRVSVLVIVPHNGAAMAKAVGLAHAAGVPVIAYDRLIPDCDLDFYITFDAVKVGKVQAQYLLDHLQPVPRRGRIIRLHGAKTDHNAHLMKQGQDEVLLPLIQSGDIIVAHEDWVDEWKPENAKRITNSALSRLLPMAITGPVLQGILAPNDGTAGGAIVALTEEGLLGKVVVTGQDAELTACQRVLAGTQTMTVYKPLTQLARKAAEVAVAMARGKTVVAKAETFNGQVQVPSIFVDVVAVDAKNMMQTVVADGFHSAQKLQQK